MDDLPTTHRLMTDGFGETPLTEHREWLEWTERNYVALARLYQPPYGERGIVLKSTGELIGMVGYVSCFGPFDTLPYFQARSSQPTTGLCTTEFGLFWVVDLAQRGKGYAGEAAQAMIDHAFQQLNLQRIIATTEYDNLNSQAVMRKLGMTIERNPHPEPFWFQVVGILENPQNATLSLENAQENLRNV